MGSVMPGAMFGSAFADKRVLVTGHTGFKGSWLCMWLNQLGAQVTGFALDPSTQPSLFDAARVASTLTDIRGDVRDKRALEAALLQARPDFVFHLAAQPLVLDSYAAPAETFAINVTGSINLLEAMRATGTRATVVMVTTDKVYANHETGQAYREDDPLGGHDPYSASKAAMEIAVASWRSSFFPPEKAAQHGVRVATARAGNVIGGGDWSANRLVPDLMRMLERGEVPHLRNPRSLRPWQHVLEPLSGYVWLAAQMASPGGEALCQAWNFGPPEEDLHDVAALADALLAAMGKPGWREVGDGDAPHEAGLLRLAIGKARDKLGWHPVWKFKEMARRTADAYAAMVRGEDASAVCASDLEAWHRDSAELGLPFA